MWPADFPSTFNMPTYAQHAMRSYHQCSQSTSHTDHFSFSTTKTNWHVSMSIRLEGRPSCPPWVQLHDIIQQMTQKYHAQYFGPLQINEILPICKQAQLRSIAHHRRTIGRLKKMHPVPCPCLGVADDVRLPTREEAKLFAWEPNNLKGGAFDRVKADLEASSPPVIFRKAPATTRRWRRGMMDSSSRASRSSSLSRHIHVQHWNN